MKRRALRGACSPIIPDSAALHPGLQRHIDYVHINPVKHGLVREVAAWPYSTFHAYVARGVYPPDWGDSGDLPRNVGE
jgi:hypothetical protein